jgi:glycosyltransferase involved in cell wall biosynthesis
MVSRWRAIYRRYERKYGRPDLFHAHSLLFGGIAASALSADTGVPYIVTEHSSTLMAGKLIGWQRALAAKSARSSGKRYAVSGTLARHLGAYLEAGAWEIMPNLIGDEFFEHRPRKGGSRPFRFMTVGNLVPLKRVDLVISAFATSGLADAELVIVGGGAAQSSLEDLAHASGAIIRFLGKIDRASVVEQMSTADCLVHASMTETFGVVVGEALAMGIPVIATRSGGPEDLLHDRNGILVPVDDVDALIGAMKAMAGNGRAGLDSAEEIRSDCLKRFGREAFLSRLVASYSAVCS